MVGIALSIAAAALVLAASMPLAIYVRSKPRVASAWARYTSFAYFAITGLWVFLVIWDVSSGRSVVFHLVAAVVTVALGLWALARNRREKRSE
jgi:hypothetical protein